MIYKIIFCLVVPIFLFSTFSESQEAIGKNEERKTDEHLLAWFNVEVDENGKATEDFLGQR